MEPFQARNTKGPEAVIQHKIIRALRGDGWYCKSTIGNEFVSGWPDVFACHIAYGSRWIEVKQPVGYNFTAAQVEEFPKFTNNGAGIWVLTHENEISKLHSPANWYRYLRWNTRGGPRVQKPKKKFIPAHGPEYRIQQEVKKELEDEDWFVKETHGSIYVQGFPDLYATHRKYGARWIEIKNPEGYVFTASQLLTFPQFKANGVGVWVLTGSQQLNLLFKPDNWWTYLEAWKS